MRRLIKKINIGVSIVVLAVFYFVFIGLGHVLYRLIVPRRKKEAKSYWEKTQKPRKESFLSPY